MEFLCTYRAWDYYYNIETRLVVRIRIQDKVIVGRRDVHFMVWAHIDTPTSFERGYVNAARALALKGLVDKVTGDEFLYAFPTERI